MSQTISVSSAPPYYGLSTLPENARGLTAIVAGANGISGQHLLRVLISRPDVWTKIYALSRSAAPPGTPAADPRVTHVSIDLLSGKEAVAEKVKQAGIPKVERDVYAFYMAYKEHSEKGLWSGQQEMWDDNGAMFENFLSALPSDSVKRIVLQTGAKHYGIHLGEVVIPMVEDSPRLDYGVYKEAPNFYYRQEDLLLDYCKAHPNTTWATTRPSNIIGSVAGNFMNEAIALSLYVLVSLELDPSKPPAFPGTYKKYNLIESQTSAGLSAYLAEWAALSHAAENEHFNSANGDSPTWARLWPSLLSQFSDHQPAEFGSEEIPKQWKGEEVECPLPAPVDGKTKSRMAMRVSLVKWANDPKVQKAWESVRDRERLDHKVWEGASWGFADGILGGQFNVVLAMEKARAKGWFGNVKTEDDWGVVVQDARNQGFLPKRGKRA